MNAVTKNKIYHLIQTWIDQRLTPNSIPFLSQGGWESWVQVELAMFCTVNEVDVQREQKIYGDNSSKVDLLFNDTLIPINENLTSNNRKRIAVEIKCQSVYYNEQTFFNAVKNDIRKLRNLDTNVYDKCMLLFIIDEGAYNHFIKQNFKLIHQNNNVAALIITLP